MKNAITEMLEFAKKTDASTAKNQITELLKNGKMTKQQFDNYKAQAESLLKLFK